jgi:hypothetical protein
LNVRVAAQGLDGVDGEVVRRCVGFAALEELPPRTVFRHDAEHDRIEVVPFPASVKVLETAKNEALVDRVGLEDVRPAPDGELLGPFVRVRIVFGRVLDDSGRTDDRRTIGRGHGGQEERLWAAEVEADGQVIDDFHLVRGVAEPGDHVDWRASKLDPAGVRILDRLRIDSGSVVERVVGVKPERIRGEVITRFPRLSHHWLELVGGVAPQNDQHFVHRQRDRRR